MLDAGSVVAVAFASSTDFAGRIEREQLGIFPELGGPCERGATYPGLGIGDFKPHSEVGGNARVRGMVIVGDSLTKSSSAQVDTTIIEHAVGLQA